MNHRRFIVLVMVVCGFGWGPARVFAASTLRFVSPEVVALDATREFDIGVVVDSDDPLNAYVLDMSYDASRVELVSTNTAGSLITIWQTQPEVGSSGVVRMNGASTVPFSGKNGKLLRLRFRAAETAPGATFSFFSKTAVHLANGKGTRVYPQAIPLTVRFVSMDEVPASSSPSSAEEPLFPVPGNDTERPRVTFAVFQADPVNADQKLFAFLATDDISGIRSIETRARSWFVWGSWQTAQNPMAYPHGVWSVELRVTDNAGNAVRRTLYDAPALGTRLFVLALFAAVGSAVFRVLRARRRSP